MFSRSEAEGSSLDFSGLYWISNFIHTEASTVNTRGELFLVHTWTIGVSNIDIYKTALAFSENFLCNLNVLIAVSPGQN